MSKSRVVSLSIGLLTCTVALLAAGIVQACPNCKEALAANSEGGGDLVRGYFYSILFMMGMPFTILGAFSFSMYRAVKKAQAAIDHSAADDPQAGEP